MKNTRKHNHKKSFPKFLADSVSGTVYSVRAAARNAVNRQIEKQHKLLLAKYVF